MHSSEPVPAPPATGPALLQQLGRLIIRARSRSPTRHRTPAPQDVHERLLQAKLLAAKSLVPNQPSTSKQVNQQPKATDNDEPRPVIEAQLEDHVHALWNEQIPICIDVLLAPNCKECYSSVTKVDEESAYDRNDKRCLLLERWTMAVFLKKTHESLAFITSQWLLNAVRSQLHFSQLAAWLATLKDTIEEPDPDERRRKLSREQCNIKKLEANCDVNELNEDAAKRRLNIVYSIKIPGESYKKAEFSRPPTDHCFPVTDIGNNVYLKVVLQSLPRIDDIPSVKCTCQPKRRVSKESLPLNLHEELALRMNDLTLGPPDQRALDYRCRGALFSPDLGVINSNIGSSSGVSRRLSIFSNPGSSEYLYSRASTPERQEESDKPSPSKEGKTDAAETKDQTYLVDDRMHTPCSESGKHKCQCDDESDHGKENRRSSTSFIVDADSEPKKLDERRLKEIAKYKRRLRKESKLRKLRESGTSESATSEGDGPCKRERAKDEPHTSIPILQASRFDRLRAIGCYRNQTYLTLPASRIEVKSPLASEPPAATPTDYRKTISVSTQTEEAACACGARMELKCESCGDRGMVRSEGTYNLASMDRSEILLEAIRRSCHEAPSREARARRKRDEEDKAMKKHKCDKISNSFKCDIDRSKVVDSFSDNDPPAPGVRKVPDDRVDDSNVIKRPKLRRLIPTIDRIDKVVNDRIERSENCDVEQLGPGDTVASTPTDGTKEWKERKKVSSVSDDEYTVYLKNDYGSFDRSDVSSPTPNPLVGSEGFKFPDPAKPDNQVPSPSEMDKFRWRFDSAASMVFHTRTGLPLTSSPAPLKRGNNCFDYDDSITGISGIKSALFHPEVAERACAEGWASPRSPASPAPPPRPAPPPPPRHAPRRGPSAGLLGSFEESALKGRLEPVATVHGFTAELGASGAFCPPHKRLPVTVFFYAPGGTNAPYMGHINLGGGGYRVARAGTVQVSLFNPHGTLVKMFVVLYDLSAMPPAARTFLRQRTLYLPAGRAAPAPAHRGLRYLIHLRFLTSKSGKLYLHTDIRIIVSRKSDLDTATAHSALFKPLSSESSASLPSANRSEAADEPTNRKGVNRVFGGCSDGTSSDDYNGVSMKSERDVSGKRMNRSEACMELSNQCSEGDVFELGVENQNGVSYELRSFTYGPENPKYSPR